MSDTMNYNSKDFKQQSAFQLQATVSTPRMMSGRCILKLEHFQRFVLMTSNIFHADRVEMLSLGGSIKQLYTFVKRKLSYTSTSGVDFRGK